MKVAILGTAASRKAAPFGDDSYEWWGINNLYVEQLPVKWGRWFEIHHILIEDGAYTRRGKKKWRNMPIEKYLTDLDAIGCPIYMQRQWPMVKQSVAYPLEAMLKRFGNYFTCTMAYMMALAISEGAEEIGLWGVDCAVSSPLATSDEYGRQKPCVEYWVGMARGMGIRVTIPDEGDLCKVRFLYGFEEPLENEFTAKLDQWERKATEEQKKWHQASIEAEAKFNQAIGGKAMLDRIKQSWANDYGN